MRARNLVAVAIFIDVKGAFDAVGHGAILRSLNSIGIIAMANLWILNYL